MSFVFGYRLLPNNPTTNHKNTHKKKLLKNLAIALLWFVLYFSSIFLIGLPGYIQRQETINHIEAETAQKQQIEAQEKRNERQAQGLPPEREPYQFQNWYVTH